MQQMTSEQAGVVLRQVCIPVLTHEHASTSRVIAAIPADKSDYRPDPVAKTAMELAWHIVSAETRFMDAALTGAFNLTPNPKPESIRTPADLTTWYEENFQSRLGKIQNLSDEQAAKIIDFRGAMQIPAAMILNIAVRHSVHHRGQLSVYLRPMGAKVPAIYGESYDSAQARAAQNA